MTPIVEVEVNLEAAQKFGIKPGDARRAAATLMQGSSSATSLKNRKSLKWWCAAPSASGMT